MAHEMSMYLMPGLESFKVLLGSCQITFEDNYKDLCRPSSNVMLSHVLRLLMNILHVTDTKDLLK